MAEIEYVRKDIFDLHMQRMEAVVALNVEAQKAMNERLEGKIEALGDRVDKSFSLMDERMEKRLAQIDGKIEVLNECMEKRLAQVDGKIEVLNERINKNLAQYETLAARLEGKIETLNTRFDTQQTRFGWYLTVFGIVITGVIAALQYWKP